MEHKTNWLINGFIGLIFAVVLNAFGRVSDSESFLLLFLIWIVMNQLTLRSQEGEKKNGN